MIEHEFNLGDKLRDKVTGLEGVVLVIAKYATGCIHYGIQSDKVKEDGTIANWEWLDESRFKLMIKKAVDFNIENPTSGPAPTGPSM